MSKFFLLGTGYLGGSVLTNLLKPEVASRLHLEPGGIAALTRSDKGAQVLADLGVKAIRGNLEDADAIVNQVIESDVVIHAAGADDLASAKAIVRGLEKRAELGLETIYLHTSGNAAFADDAAGAHPNGTIYNDDSPEQFDALPDTALHRNVDTVLAAASRALYAKGQRIAIALPPPMFGEGIGPFSKIPLFVMLGVVAAAKLGRVPVVGEGKNSIAVGHVQDVADSYITIIRHLQNSQNDPKWHPYFTMTTSEILAIDYAQALANGLQVKGIKVASTPSINSASVFAEATGAPVPVINCVFGANALSLASRLSTLGWKAQESRPDILASVPGDIDVLLPVLAAAQ